MKKIDIINLAHKISKESFIFKKLNVITDYKELGIFNNFTVDEIHELGKQIYKDERKYKLTKLNEKK